MTFQSWGSWALGKLWFLLVFLNWLPNVCHLAGSGIILQIQLIFSQWKLKNWNAHLNHENRSRSWFTERDHQENALYVFFFFFHFCGITKIWFLNLSFFYMFWFLTLIDLIPHNLLIIFNWCLIVVSYHYSKYFKIYNVFWGCVWECFCLCFWYFLKVFSA